MLTPAVPADAAPMTALFDAGFAPYAHALGRENVTRKPWVKAGIAASHAWWIDGDVGAVIMARDGSTLALDALVIDPARQGAGQGRRALTLIETHGRETGATEVALHTAQAACGLVAFYSRAEYRVVAVGPHPKGRDDRLRVFFIKSLV